MSKLSLDEAKRLILVTNYADETVTAEDHDQTVSEENWYEHNHEVVVPGMLIGRDDVGFLVELVEDIGGVDEGSYRAYVFKTTPIAFGKGKDLTVQWFRKEGYYSSYEGTEWDGAFEEVEPRVVTVTKYFAVRRLLP